jgi:hypothetical protein
MEMHTIKQAVQKAKKSKRKGMYFWTPMRNNGIFDLSDPARWIYDHTGTKQGIGKKLYSFAIWISRGGMVYVNSVYDPFGLSMDGSKLVGQGTEMTL